MKNLRGIQSRETFSKCRMHCFQQFYSNSYYLNSNEVRSTFNLWSTLLAEARKTSRERAALAEILASEMVARLDIMAKDVQMLAKRVSC